MRTLQLLGFCAFGACAVDSGVSDRPARPSMPNIVLINAGGALWVAGAAGSLEEGIELARESIDSGAARERLERLIAASHEGARSDP